MIAPIAGSAASASTAARWPWPWLCVALAVLVLQVLVLYAMGRVPICECGTVKLFEPLVNSPGNSQHLADWYTPSHIIPRFSVLRSCLSAVSSPVAVGAAHLRGGDRSRLGACRKFAGHHRRYRTATMALGYSGDSIVNSAMDTVFMAVGFLIAARLPVWATVLVAVFFELLTGYLIRDNLTLNVLMLVWPVDAVRTWQSAV